MRFTIALCLSFVLSVSCKTIEVKSAEELKKALTSVSPGDTIHLNDGKYSDKFTATISGSSSSPITLTGSKSAVLSSTSYGFWLKASYWVLKGFSVTGAKKGIVVEGGSHNILDDLEVSKIEQEGIHFRYNSADNILRNSYIHTTGLDTPGFGEGVYIGQAFSNWLEGKPDKSDRNQVLNNRIGPNVAAECVDIKEGSCCGLIKGNTFDGVGESGENYADSHIDLKGDNYTIEDNTGSHPLLNGFELHYVAKSSVGGCNNKIIDNKCASLPKTGKCVANSVTRCTNIIENNKLP